MLVSGVALALLMMSPVPGLHAAAAGFGLGTQQAASQQAARNPERSANTPLPPKPNPDAAGTYHAGAGVSPPVVTYSVEPEFSDQARRKKLNGTTVISLVVDSQGVPRDVHVSHSIASDSGPKLRSAALSLDAKALEAVKQYRFRPATVKGKPVPFATDVGVEFRIY